MAGGVQVGSSGMNVGTSGVCVTSSDSAKCCCDGTTCDAIYKPARKCSDDTLVDIVMLGTDADTITGAFSVPGADPRVCYHFTDDDLRCKTDDDTVLTPSDVDEYDDCSQCAPTGCTCAGLAGDLATSYAIKDYFDGYFSVAGCACGDSAASPWDGTFTTADILGSGCEWDLDVGKSIDGKALDEGKIVLSGGAAPNCGWGMNITCAAGPDDVWSGNKVGGGSPVGTYTRISGCDTRPTVVIE